MNKKSLSANQKIHNHLLKFLSDKKILVTGAFKTSRDELKEKIILFGGTISSSISKNLDIIISGENPGPKKIKKANELGLKIISEEDFYKIIDT